MNCGLCHNWYENHPYLSQERQTDEYGLCMSPFQPHQAQHKDNVRCVYWQEREPERLLRECPGCGRRVWKWLWCCPHCGYDLRLRCTSCGLPLEGEPPVCQCEVRLGSLGPRTKKSNRVQGGNGHGWLGMRRANVGW